MKIDKLEYALIELEVIVDNFCFMAEKKRLDEMELLKIIAREMPVEHIGGYRGKHSKKTAANKKTM